MASKDASVRVSIKQMEDFVEEMSPLEKSNMIALAGLSDESVDKLNSPMIKALVRVIRLVARMTEE